MKLIFERGIPGTSCGLLPPCDVARAELTAKRELPLSLPELTEGEISRHYTELESQVFGVNSGYYPLGSCTMKYNPKLNEEMAGLPGFAEIHPLQPAHTTAGCAEALKLAEEIFCEITGMDSMSFQPAAGAHGELTGLILMKNYHGNASRDKILVPDTAHGTNPASVTMAGFKAVSVPSGENGLVDLDALRKAAGPDTAGLMLTNPNTLGLFEKDILEIAEIIHNAGGLLYYDGANLNPIMGIARPGDMGFDVVHLNLHKTFATPHGGGGPGSGPVGCKAFLAPFMPKVKAFYGNFAVVVKALTYVLTLGREGIPEAARSAVLNANYMMKRLDDLYKVAYPGCMGEQSAERTTSPGHCMHEFVLTAEPLKKETGVSALDIAKGLLDNGMHPPTIYFPINVHEALMVEPTETESKASIDAAADIYRQLYELAYTNPQALHDAPINTPVRRLDEVTAAREPILRYKP